MRFHTILFASLALLFVGSLARAEDTTGEALAATDLKVLNHHHRLHKMEIAMGKLARKRGTSAVKKYAAMLVKDHQRSELEVVALAKQRGVTLSDHPGADEEIAIEAHEDAMREMAEMARLRGAAFDAAFLAEMVDGHLAELSRLELAVAAVSDSGLVEYLERVRPKLLAHADRAAALLAD